jgi:multiple inositol-polyphosphate phosphatase/2,3-bisphosphoglycerate 3-phosphatase
LSTSKSNTSTKKIKKKQEALGWLKDWKIPYPNEKAGWLANAGVHELMKMGRRLRQHFFRQQTHHHYDHYYHSDKYIFEHTWKIRTKQSAFAFANGFFDGHQFVNYQTDPIGKDEELRFFDNCPAFHQQIDTNQTAIRQYQLYRDSLQMNKNLKKFMTYTRVDTRGNHSIKLTQKDLEAAYAACAFDIALQESNTRNWCRFFDQEMLLSMDFYQDLKHFYKKSHGDGTTGHLLAWEIASPLLQDFFTSMKQKILGQSTIQAHFRFAHAETILPFVTLLNLTQFDPDQHTILHANFTIKELLERKFHSSFLSPFAANIGFVLYQCPSLSKKEQKEHFVKLFLNEKEVQMKDCHKNLCRFEFLEKKFQKWLQEYNFQQSCSTIN